MLSVLTETVGLSLVSLWRRILLVEELTCNAFVIVIVIRHLYSATYIRGSLDPGQCLH